MSVVRDKFRSDLECNGAPPPWRLCDEYVGVILEADGGNVLQVDTDRARSDESAAEIALAIVVAVNTCAGYHPTLVQGDG